MTFNEVLSQTIVMLHQHGRVSYRALKQQFGLDDDDLADLTEALLCAHPQAVDVCYRRHGQADRIVQTLDTSIAPWSGILRGLGTTIGPEPDCAC